MIAALPLPLTPALVFAGISGLPVVEVLFALWLGKLLKYSVYSWVASAFPAFVIEHGHHRVAAIQTALERAASADTGKP